MTARTLLVAGLATIACLTRADAQKPARELKRPKLEAGADTNDALAYYRFGTLQFTRDPENAERAFYWATRIAPSWAEAYYARSAAMQLQFTGRPSKAQTHAVDSLDAIAEKLNPFLFRRLDLQVIEALVRRNYDPEDASDIMFEVMRSDGDPASDAERAFVRSRFADAADLYAKAIAKGKKKRPWLHEDRAMAFYQLQKYDSAAAELSAFLAAERAREDTALDRGYLSKAFAEYQLGAVFALAGDTAAARAAFGRALTEDLTYAPAHVALASLAQNTNDLAGAVTEAEAAVQAHDEDAVLHYTLGRMLVQAGRADEAEKELKRAQALEPYYALPYFLLARLYDASAMEEDAKTQYAAFLGHGSRMLSEYEFASQRLAALQAPATGATAPAGAARAP